MNYELCIIMDYELRITNRVILDYELCIMNYALIKVHYELITVLGKLRRISLQR